MNSTILAERQAKAILAIRAETARLGGEIAQPPRRVDSPATGYTLMLEAIAQALASIEPSVPSPEPPVESPTPAAYPGRRKGQL